MPSSSHSPTPASPDSLQHHRHRGSHAPALEDAGAAARDVWSLARIRRSQAAPLVIGTTAVLLATGVPALASDGATVKQGGTTVTLDGAVESGSAAGAITSTSSAQRVPIAQDAFTVILQAKQERDRLRAQQAARTERTRKAKARKAKVAAAKAERARKAALREKRARSWVPPTASGSVSTRFGVSGSAWSSGRHTGIDFRGSTGDTIRTVHTGVVVFAGSDGPYGNHVKVRHSSGHETWYAHLSSISVRVGQKVVSGDQLGRMGSTGNSSGSHLHFEVHLGGGSNAIEPLAFLRKHGLRLG